jgi:hypothetical protein
MNTSNFKDEYLEISTVMNTSNFKDEYLEILLSRTDTWSPKMDI